jgi:hypothetical protein
VVCIVHLLTPAIVAEDVRLDQNDFPGCHCLGKVLIPAATSCLVIGIEERRHLNFTNPILGHACGFDRNHILCWCKGCGITKRQEANFRLSHRRPTILRSYLRSVVPPYYYGIYNIGLLVLLLLYYRQLMTADKEIHTPTNLQTRQNQRIFCPFFTETTPIPLATVLPRGIHSLDCDKYIIIVTIPKIASQSVRNDDQDDDLHSSRNLGVILFLSWSSVVVSIRSGGRASLLPLVLRS